MVVQLADGIKLGSVKNIWFTEDVDARTMKPGLPRGFLEVVSGMLWWRRSLYIPCSVVANVNQRSVLLDVDATSERMHTFLRQPAGLPLKVCTFKVHDAIAWLEAGSPWAF
jgi:hypothetical protein